MNTMPLSACASTYRIHCSTCTYSVDHQKSDSRHLNCCGRIVCGDCIAKNPRFGIYCPFCQSPCPKRDGDGGGEAERETPFRPLPPPYTPAAPSPPPPSYRYSTTGGVIHYVRAADTLPTIALQYSLPLPLLRSHNRIFSDHLLHGRRSVDIPSPPYVGPSLSPAPEDIEGEGRKAATKRFQLKTKCLDADVADIYLQEAGWDEELAAKDWEMDERWVRDNPMLERSVGKGKGREVVSGKKGGGSKWGLRGFGY
ncbi:hypothetical protein HOY80DRAFT_624916 [Tuber brumale]|nr:hypothetical protein HOY80DRAFT_624916 [Tuber brumale]